MKRMSLLINFVTVGNWCRDLKKTNEEERLNYSFFCKAYSSLFFTSFKKYDSFYSVQKKTEMHKKYCQFITDLYILVLNISILFLNSVYFDFKSS